jgi:hypothetical protein
MTAPRRLIFAGATLLLASHSLAGVRGSVGTELNAFAHSPRFPDQSKFRLCPSVYANVETTASAGSMRYELDAFARAADDSSRPSGDVRQASATLRTARGKYRIGVLTETWGVLEASSPVDVFNQRDLAEDFQGTVKLGQPGASATWQFGDVEVSTLASTWARARRFAHGRDRLRVLPLPIAESVFEHGRWAPDVAVRARWARGDGSLAISHFAGHSREPELLPVIGPTGPTGLRASYDRIGQTALEAQYVIGDSVLKAEVIHRTDAPGAFWGGGIGVEKGIANLGDNASLTLFGELYLDGRSDAAPMTPFQRDLFLGARCNVNDARDTTLELRITHDLQWHSDLLDARAAWRAGKGMVSASLLRPIDAERDPGLQGLSQDTHLQLGYAWCY